MNSDATTSAGTKRGRSVPGARRKNRSALMIVGIVGVAILALGAIFAFNNPGGATTGSSQAGKYPFEVGQPGPGQQAPAITLPSTAGDTFDLVSLRGKTVLLYFQEGIMCQPCWNQIKDIEAQMPQLQALGIDRIVTITSDELGSLKQKVADEGLTTPVLSDPNLAVSKTYGTNTYGMMGSSYNGHSFIVVGPDGRILWRADYGGAPKYTMYVPVQNLFADMQVGLAKARQGQ